MTGAFHGFKLLDTGALQIYLKPIKTQLTIYNLTLCVMRFEHFYQIKHKNMVAISRQYLSGADRAVHIGQVFCR